MKRVFVAIDTPDLAHATTLCQQLQDELAGVKLGLEFFATFGAAGVRHIQQACALPVFLDLKLHDIPNTVAKTITALLPLHCRFLTIHAQGGTAMLHAAAKAAAGSSTQLLAVTVLTSMDTSQLQGIGITSPAHHHVLRLAELAQGNGITGIVASAQEAGALRQAFGNALTLVTPGIRPTSTATGDQQRIATPEAAISAGADYLVIGRPITTADNPLTALKNINQKLIK